LALVECPNEYDDGANAPRSRLDRTERAESRSLATTTRPLVAARGPQRPGFLPHFAHDGVGDGFSRASACREDKASVQRIGRLLGRSPGIRYQQAWWLGG
jgi:hypothetical protein